MKKGILLAASLVVAGGIAADAQSITGDDVRGCATVSAATRPSWPYRTY